MVNLPPLDNSLDFQPVNLLWSNNWVLHGYALIRSTKKKTKIRRRQIINSTSKTTGQNRTSDTSPMGMSALHSFKKHKDAP